MPQTLAPQTISAKHRRALHAWPEGVTRSLYASQGVSPIDRREFSHMKLRWFTRLGYLRESETTHNASWNRTWTRTDKPVTLPRVVNRRYRGDYPWSVEAHWKQLCETGSRGAANLRQLLMNREPWTKFDTSFQRMWVDGMLVETVSQLRTVREAVLHVMRGTFAPGSRAELQHLNACFMHPTMLRWLLCDMQVEPTFNEGSFTGFVARDPSDCVAEIERLRASSPSHLLSSYHQSYVSGRK